jgi:hypothetical protein
LSQSIQSPPQVIQTNQILFRSNAIAAIYYTLTRYREAIQPFYLILRAVPPCHIHPSLEVHQLEDRGEDAAENGAVVGEVADDGSDLGDEVGVDDGGHGGDDGQGELDDGVDNGDDDVEAGVQLGADDDEDVWMVSMAQVFESG